MGKKRQDRHSKRSIPILPGINSAPSCDTPHCPGHTQHIFNFIDNPHSGDLSSNHFNICTSTKKTLVLRDAFEATAIVSMIWAFFFCLSPPAWQLLFRSTSTAVWTILIASSLLTMHFTYWAHSATTQWWRKLVSMSWSYLCSFRVFKAGTKEASFPNFLNFSFALCLLYHLF